uniref:CAAX prenyl protease n=1 Tax=Globisporangium ultimum (strain ATCC 200006 / CBS 805.95 / DAOM BR144) TaxID=431595 RepID=K3WYJ3_GLOUD
MDWPSIWRFAPYFTEDGWTPATVPFLQASLLFLTLVYVFETYLDLRQHQKLKETKFPEPLADAIRALDDAAAAPQKPSTEKNLNKDSEDNTSDDEDEASGEKPVSASLLDATLEKFDKSCAYGLDQSTLKFFSCAYTHVQATALVLFGYLPFLWVVSGNALTALGLDASNEICHSLMFFLLNLLREIVVKLPVDLYSTFVIEARHGFNKQTVGIFFVDKLKLFLLLLGICCPLIAGLVYLVRWGGEHFYVYVWAFKCAVTVFIATLLPLWILPLLEKFTPLEEGELRTRLEALASSIKFPLTSISVVDGSTRSGHSSAYCAGLLKTQRIVIYDTLLEQITNDEVVAVLAHELGHWKLAHALKGFLVEQVHDIAFAYIFGMCMNNSELYASFGFAGDSGMPVMIGYMLFSKTVWAPVSHVLSFLLRLNTRRTEFQSDAFAVDLGHGETLKSALTKVAIGNLTNMNPDPLYSKYHYDHPPLVERLAAITARTKKSM